MQGWTSPWPRAPLCTVRRMARWCRPVLTAYAATTSLCAIQTGCKRCISIWRAALRASEGVTRGQVIASAGSTGMSTGAHLHFELIYNGVRYDPSAALLAS